MFSAVLNWNACRYFDARRLSCHRNLIMVRVSALNKNAKRNSDARQVSAKITCRSERSIIKIGKFSWSLRLSETNDGSGINLPTTFEPHSVSQWGICSIDFAYSKIGDCCQRSYRKMLISVASPCVCVRHLSVELLKLR